MVILDLDSKDCSAMVAAAVDVEVLDGAMVEVVVRRADGSNRSLFYASCAVPASAEHAAAAIAGMAAEAAIILDVFLGVGDGGRRYQLIRPVVDDAGVGHQVIKEYRIEQ